MAGSVVGRTLTIRGSTALFIRQIQVEEFLLQGYRQISEHAVSPVPSFTRTSLVCAPEAVAGRVAQFRTNTLLTAGRKR
jgi:hypothetical protein